MPSNSNTSPEKLIPIINHVYYEGPLQHDEEEMNDNHKDGVIYGPPTLDDANDPYATPNCKFIKVYAISWFPSSVYEWKANCETATHSVE